MYRAGISDFSEIPKTKSPDTGAWATLLVAGAARLRMTTFPAPLNGMSSGSGGRI